MTGGMFPRVKERCHPARPEACCDGRRLAVRSGEMYFDFERGGWVSVLNPLRSATWEAVYKSEQNHNGEPYLLELCPYCGSELPALTRRGGCE